MSITKLEERATESSVYGIRCEFNEKLSDGTLIPFAPNAGLKWSLRDSSGAPINARVSVDIASAQSIIIVLQGADLALTGGPVTRHVTISGTYDGTLGDGLPIVAEASFQITNLVGKP
jgi:hypothetical protein